MSYNLNFHQTFKPEREHISSLITLKEISATKEEISHRFGIPTGKSSGKVEVAILYAQAAGFLNFYKKKGIYNIVRTKLGDIIFDNDKHLDYKITQLLIHYFFCSKNSYLNLWKLFFNEYRSVSNQVDINFFEEFAEKKLKAKNIKTAPLIGTYISVEDPIVDLNILSKVDKDLYEYGEIEIHPKYVSFYIYFIIYQLTINGKEKKDFTLDNLLTTGFHNIFGWDVKQLRWILELGEYSGYISLNKQFDNYHIYLNISNEELLQKMY